MNVKPSVGHISVGQARGAGGAGAVRSRPAGCDEVWAFVRAYMKASAGRSPRFPACPRILNIACAPCPASPKPAHSFPTMFNVNTTGSLCA